MKKILTLMLVVPFGLPMAQTTTTTDTRSNATETYTRTETVSPNGQTITTTTHTPAANADAVFGIKLNVNLSNFIIRDANDCQSKMNPGFSTGVFLKIASNNFALQYELLLRYKNLAVKNTGTNTQTTYNYWGLELPIYFMGQMDTKTGKAFIGAGPYVSVGIDGTGPGNTDLYKKDKATGKPIMHRWDFGLGATGGYEFNNGISINGGYQLGLINALSAQKDTMTLKNQCVNLGLGYRF